VVRSASPDSVSTGPASLAATEISSRPTPW
jgi:hypothetical protein